LRAAKGISEAARGNLLALQAAAIPYSAIDYETDIPRYQQTEPTLKGINHAGFKFAANLIHVNAPELPYLWSSFGRHNLAGRFNIGVWYWELPDFPDQYCSAFSLVDEVWVGSQFVLESISAKSPVPVIKIPPCIHVVYDYGLQRSDFGLPADRFLFLCAYDVLSAQARKNPLATVEAFKRAFPRNDSSVGLVIKISSTREDPAAPKVLHDALSGYSNCYFIDKMLRRSAMNSLLSLTDAYVSLHRSEGFGLIAAEAMSLGKPVIMTRWSGNLDMMTSDNSCGVDYKLVPVGEGADPYAPYDFWAEPDVDHAAFFMRQLHSDREYYARISSQAASSVGDRFSPGVIGHAMRMHLQQRKLL
jgi:glycosyltransferase involved in cell wall biosynthesis